MEGFVYYGDYVGELVFFNRFMIGFWFDEWFSSFKFFVVFGILYIFFFGNSFNKVFSFKIFIIGTFMLGFMIMFIVKWKEGYLVRLIGFVFEFINYCNM